MVVTQFWKRKLWRHGYAEYQVKRYFQNGNKTESWQEFKLGFSKFVRWMLEW